MFLYGTMSLSITVSPKVISSRFISSFSRGLTTTILNSFVFPSERTTVKVEEPTLVASISNFPYV